MNVSESLNELSPQKKAEIEIDEKYNHDSLDHHVSRNEPKYMGFS